MDCERDLIKLCKPLFVKLTRISNLDINKWKRGTKHMDRPHPRRRTLSAWQRGDCRSSKSQKIQNIRKRATKCVVSDSDDELSEFQVCDNDQNITMLNRCGEVNGTDVATHEKQSEIINSAIMLPKNNMPISDKFAWKYKRKRRKLSQSLNKIVRGDESNGEPKKIAELNNSNFPNDHETTQVDLSKEIKIVSSRLEDSDDPQVERWRSKKKTSSSPKSKPRLPPKLISLNCTVCSLVFDSKEQLSNHIFKHTQRELQDAYKAAKTKLRENESNGDVGNDSGGEIDGACDMTVGVRDQSADMESPTRKQTSQITATVSVSTDTLTKVSSSVPIVICSCHGEHHPQNDASVQIEMVLFCETCHVLFRRSECFETHYRFSAKCNADRTKGRTPKLFCSTCRIILNTLSNMRRHLEEHASVNFHGTVTFVCNICRVVFFGVGTVFCTHWFNHEKDPTFVASRYSFPKLCVSTQGVKPSGSAPDEQYFFVAEYVCRSCKFQFSSESELTTHMEKDCKGATPVKSNVQSKSDKSKPLMINSGPSKSNVETNISSNDSVPLKPLDMINKWICEFCDECYSSRSAFEEHSSKHLQDDGYPGYSCVFQWDASTAFICNVCRGVHTTLQDLMKHWVTHEVIKFICTVCNEKCSSYNSFEAHISLACWKSKPDCRVWFNRTQISCKICRSVYKSSEELAHHYAFDHVIERDNNISVIKHTASRSIIDTPPASETSINSQYKGKNLNKLPIEKSCKLTDNQAASINLGYPDSDITSNTPSAASDIENTISKKPPLTKLSTTKITIQNLLEQSPMNQSATDSLTFSSSTQNEISGSCEFRSASSSMSSSNKANINTPDSPIITQTLENQSLDSCKATINIAMDDTSSRRTNVITTNTAILRNGDDNARLEQNIVQDSDLRQSIITASLKSGSAITSTSSNEVSLADNISELRRRNDTVALIIKNVDNVSIIADKELEISESEEPEIIEIPNKLIDTSNTLVQNEILHEPELMGVKKCVSERQLEKNCSSPNIHTLVQDENIGSSFIESVETMDKCLINADASKPRGFLRVKKFTELQAVRNYTCDRCSSVFDNVMSLDEHILAHDTLATGNSENSTKMPALILTQDMSCKVLRESSIPTTMSTVPQMAGKRTLPYIPQRDANMNSRKASPLTRGQTSNKLHNSPNIHSLPNAQNFVQGQQYYVCPVCRLVFRCQDLMNHLATDHPNISIPAINTSSNSLNIPQNAMDTTSKEKKVYTCKICKYTTHERESIDKHVGFYHFSQYQQNISIVPPNGPEPVQQIDLTVPSNDRITPNTVPPFKCSLCTNYQYNTIGELAQHFQIAHHSIRKDIYQPYVCHFCLLSFQTYEELIIHENFHRSSGWT